MTSSIGTVGEESFNAKVLEADLPVLVTFTAEWSGPDKKLKPILEDIATSYEGKLLVYTCDSEGNPGLSAKYGVSAVPSLILIKQGKMVGKNIGAVDKETLKTWLDGQLK